LVFADEQLTYRELNERSNQLAHYLVDQYGVEVEDLIGIKLRRSEWLVVSMLGVLKSGGAYVPIDPNYPEERISYIESDSDCKLVIDDVVLENFRTEGLDYDIEKPEVNLISENLMYVIYTSGSTGNP
ncbi:AMP-binding protein, partial [Aquimarina algiphila]